ncbi:MAG TPA: SH3 domain-containing protein [Coleofasciculaceae cyanobacterium]
MNDMQQEQLFTDLTPDQASMLEGGGVSLYTTKGVNDRLNIRSGPSTRASIVGTFFPGDIIYMELPAIVRNGFRKLSSSPRNKPMWVSTKFIQPVVKETLTPRPETGFGSRPV